MIFWLLMIGWGYAVLGLVSGFFLFAFYTIHTERCDNCVFGRDVPNWRSATILAKIGVVLSIGSVFTWPLAVLYTLFVAWPSTKFERWFAKPKDNSIQSIVRAWYKRNRRRGWQIHVDLEDSVGNKRRQTTVQIYHNKPSAHIKISDEKCELEWRREDPVKSTDGKWLHRTISPSNPQFFDTLTKFMSDISASEDL